MNLTNLKRMYNHILLNVSEKKIKMDGYRSGKRDKHKCGSSGCVIGHCTIIDKYENIPKKENGEIKFGDWSEEFTGLTVYSYRWFWCFGPRWSNNKEQILLRLKYLIDNQKLPDDWTKDCDFSFILLQQKLEPYKI